MKRFKTIIQQPLHILNQSTIKIQPLYTTLGHSFNHAQNRPFSLSIPLTFGHSENCDENQLKRLSPNRQFKSFFRLSPLIGKYNTLMNVALEKLELFGENHKELVLDNQYEVKYLPVVIQRQFGENKVIKPGYFKELETTYYDSFGYIVNNQENDDMYCNPKTLNDVNARRIKYLNSIEFMQGSKEDFSNILAPLQMIPISEKNVWTHFSGHENINDVLLICCMDQEFLLEIHGRLATYCNYLSEKFNIPFESVPIQISYFNEFQKSMIEKSIVEALEKIEQPGMDQYTSVDSDLLKRWLTKPNIISHTKMENIYFPKMRNSMIDFMLLLL